MLLDTPKADSETFLFADLCGFADYTYRHGDQLAADLATAFHERVRELAAEESCDVVKVIGDAVMVRSADCRDAIRLARRILLLGELEGHPRVRIGIDSGPAVQRHGDWYGSTVNAAARVTDAARPGELLVTERTRAAVAQTLAIDAGSCRVPRLKGLPAFAVYALAA